MSRAIWNADMKNPPRRSKAPEFKLPPWESPVDPAPPAVEQEETPRQPAMTPGPQTQAQADKEPRRPAVVPAQLEGMLVQLSIEEAGSSKELRTVSFLSSLFLGAVGLMMVVWGVVATVRTAQAGIAGATGGLILMVFGGGFIGIAAWTAIRYSKRRGER